MVTSMTQLVTLITPTVTTNGQAAIPSSACKATGVRQCLGRLSTFQNDSMERFDPWTYGKGVNGMSYTSANTMDGRVNNAVRYDTRT